MTDNEPTPRCTLASCRAPFLPSQPGQKYCSRKHARTAEKQRQRERKKFGETVKELVARRTETYDTDPSQRWSDDPSQFSDYGEVPGDLGDDEHRDDEQGTHSGHSAPDPWRQRNEAWAAHQALGEAIDALHEDFDRKARPFIGQQRRNPGTKLSPLAALERERDARIAELQRDHYLTNAYRQAEQDRPGRIVTAHERAVEQAAARSFAMDLGRGRHLRDDLADAGRDVRDAWVW